MKTKKKFFVLLASFLVVENIIFVLFSLGRFLCLSSIYSVMIGSLILVLWQYYKTNDNVIAKALIVSLTTCVVATSLLLPYGVLLDLLNTTTGSNTALPKIFIDGLFLSINKMKYIYALIVIIVGVYFVVRKCQSKNRDRFIF